MPAGLCLSCRPYPRRQQNLPGPPKCIWLSVPGWPSLSCRNLSSVSYSKKSNSREDLPVCVAVTGLILLAVLCGYQWAAATPHFSLGCLQVPDRCLTFVAVQAFLTARQSGRPVSYPIKDRGKVKQICLTIKQICIRKNQICFLFRQSIKNKQYGKFCNSKD